MQLSKSPVSVGHLPLLGREALACTVPLTHHHPDLQLKGCSPLAKTRACLWHSGVLMG